VLHSEDKILMKNMWEHKRSFAKIRTKHVSTKNWKRWSLDHFLRQMSTTVSVIHTPGSGRFSLELILPQSQLYVVRCETAVMSSHAIK